MNEWKLSSIEHLLYSSLHLFLCFFAQTARPATDSLEECSCRIASQLVIPESLASLVSLHV